MIAPFQCVACNAPLVVVDAPSLTCRYCGAINAVPEAYREELRLARDLDEATRRAISEWARLDHIKVRLDQSSIRTLQRRVGSGLRNRAWRRRWPGCQNPPG